jgi:hypothetical protein
MRRIPKAIYQTPAELEARIRQRMDEALLLSPASEAHREIMKEIAQLRIYADAKRWLGGPSNPRGTSSPRDRFS